MIAIAAFVLASPARAEDPGLVAAKESFSRGLDLARDQKWGEALDAFETAGRAKRHALTTYNAAVAERALSRYTRARLRFAAALEEDAAAGGTELAQHYKDDTKTFLAELDALLVHVDVTLDPVDAALAIDGRPLSWTTDERTVAYAGVAPANAGERVDRKSFEVVADPGTHIFTVTKGGFDTVVSKETLRSGVRARVTLSLTEMPSKLRIDANQGRATVRLDDVDVGLAPVMLVRPAGTYRVDVRKPGFVPYNAKVSLQPGQETALFARMNEDTPLTKRWWFWAGGAGVVLIAASALVVGLIAFSEPTYTGGNLEWVARPR
jgi:hypothetical protein